MCPSPATISETPNLELQFLPLETLQPSTTNPRKNFEGPEFDELVDSVRTHGVLMPILVRPLEVPFSGAYEIVAGERRYRAALKAGLPSIHARIEDLTDKQAQEIQVIENLQRKDISPVEEADGFARLANALAKEDPKAQRKDIIAAVGKRIGKSARYVYARMKLNELIPELQKDLAAGYITSSHADELVRLCAKDQGEFAASHLYHATAWEDGKQGEKFAHSVRHIKKQISKEYQLELSKPPFPPEDPKLVPAVGICSACINNSLNSPLADDEAKKKPVCMDRSCFAKKREAFVAIEAMKQKAAKYELLRVTPMHELPYSRRNEKDKPLTRPGWKTAHPGECDSVQPAVVLDSNGLHDQAVGAKLVCANTKCKVHFGPKPDRPKPTNSASSYSSGPTESKADRDKREAELKAQAELDIAGGVALFTAVLGKIKAITQSELDVLIERLSDNLDISVEAEAAIAKYFGWERPEGGYGWLPKAAKKNSAKMALDRKAQLLVGLAICEGIDPDGYSNFTRDNLEGVAKSYKLDPKAIVEKAEADAEKAKLQTSAKPAEKKAEPKKVAAKKPSPKKVVKKVSAKKGGRK